MTTFYNKFCVVSNCRVGSEVIQNETSITVNTENVKVPATKLNTSVTVSLILYTAL